MHTEGGGLIRYQDRFGSYLIDRTCLHKPIFSSSFDAITFTKVTINVDNVRNNTVL